VTRPRARRNGLVVRELPAETLVYDRESHAAHCLDRTAGAVFRAADGTRTVEEIAAVLGPSSSACEREVAAKDALAALDRAGLLEPESLADGSRREVLRRVGIGAALLAPTVLSVLAPTPAEALATCVTNCEGNQGKACTSFGAGTCTGTETCTCNSAGCCSDKGGA
jgi:hypothetical protein